MHLSPMVAQAAVRSKAVVLLLLIRCLVCFPLIVGVLCLALSHLEEEERAGCFAFIVLWMSCYCKCSVSLPPGALWVGLRSVIVVFPDHTHLLFQILNVFMIMKNHESVYVKHGKCIFVPQGK